MLTGRASTIQRIQRQFCDIEFHTEDEKSPLSQAHNSTVVTRILSC